jgi:ABC-type transport system substrate-binding protein
VEAVKTGEGRVDLVTELSPLETLRVAGSPWASVIKNRGSLEIVFGRFNMRKTGSPWSDLRLRQAANLAINRADLVRYAAKGNVVIIPALVPAAGFGYNPTLTPYLFDPAKARQLIRDAGYPDGLAITLVAREQLELQATVVSKMLEQAGFRVERQILDPDAWRRKVRLRTLEQPAESQTWDIALTSDVDTANFPAILLYHEYALAAGSASWVAPEPPELRRLYDQVLRTVDRETQQALIRQMERHTRDQAYFLFLYNPIQLYATNKAVVFVPYVYSGLILAETSVTDQHWSVRKAAAKP